MSLGRRGADDNGSTNAVTAKVGTAEAAEGTSTRMARVGSGTSVTASLVAGTSATATSAMAVPSTATSAAATSSANSSATASP
ncbi:unnamed protein product [Prunus armeniaca]